MGNKKREKKKQLGRIACKQGWATTTKKGCVQAHQHECMALHRSAVLGAQHLGWAGGLMV